MSSPPSLRDLVSSSLKRQTLTATVPAAMRFIPLGALAASEFIGSSRVTDALLGKDQPDNVLISGGTDEAIPKLEAESAAQNGIVSCGTCSGGGLALQSWAGPSMTVAVRTGMAGITVPEAFATHARRVERVSELARLNSTCEVT